MRRIGAEASYENPEHVYQTLSPQTENTQNAQNPVGLHTSIRDVNPAQVYTNTYMPPSPLQNKHAVNKSMDHS